MRLRSTMLLLALALAACGDSGTTPSGGSGGSGAANPTGGNGGAPSAGSPSVGGGGSGEGGAGGGGTGEGGAEAGVNGSAGKGPLVTGSSILISALDMDGEPTGAIFSSVTFDALGNFDIPVNASGPARIEATGFFFNEVLGGLSSAPVALRGLVEVDGSTAQTVNVNTLTHLTQRRALSLWQGGETLADARAQAYSELIAAFELGAPGFVPGIDAADASLVDGDNDDAAYLLAVSSVAIDIATVNAEKGAVEPELTQWLEQIAIDLEDDGDLTSAHKLEIHDSEARLDAGAIVSALSDYLVQQGSEATVPNINRALDQDFDTYANIDDCLPLDPLRWTGNADLDLDLHEAVACGGDDCNDDVAAISPDEPDSVGDATDNNCDGLDGVDADGDLLASIPSGGVDCDDSDAAIGPPWQQTQTAGVWRVDGAGNHYGWRSALQEIVTDVTGAWTTFPTPAGVFSNLLVQPDGTLHLIGSVEQAIYSGGSWSTVAIASGPWSDSTVQVVVGNDGVIHAAYGSGPGNPGPVFYRTNTTSAITVSGSGSLLYGLDLDSSGEPVVCYSYAPSVVCRHPTGATIFDVPGGAPWALSMAIADDDSIYLSSQNGVGADLQVRHWDGAMTVTNIFPPGMLGLLQADIGTAGNVPYVVVGPGMTQQVLTNASGTWDSLPIVGFPGTTWDVLSGGGEISLYGAGAQALLELNPGCTP